MLTAAAATFLLFWAACHGRMTPINDDTTVWPKCLQAVASNRNQTTSRCQRICGENDLGKLTGVEQVEALQNKVPEGCEIPAYVQNIYPASGVCHNAERVHLIWFESKLDQTEGYHIRGRLQEAKLSIYSDSFTNETCSGLSAVRYASFSKVWPEEMAAAKILHNLDGDTPGEEIKCLVDVAEEDYIQKFNFNFTEPKISLDATYLFRKEFPQIGYDTFNLTVSLQSPSKTCVGVLTKIEAMTLHYVSLLGRMKEKPLHHSRDLD